VTFVNDKTPGQLCILLIDVTQNYNGFEHATANTIYASMSSSGIRLAAPKPVFADTLNEYQDAIEKYKSDFNTILLLMHGGEDPKDGNVSEIDGPSGIIDFYSLAAVTDHIKDKFIALCVCHGHCEDALSAFIDNDPLALSIIAPTTSITKSEAESFFPEFFKKLNVLSTQNIDPTHIELCLTETNHLSNHKIKVCAFHSDYIQKA
jgi:hypothetical protein